MLQQYQKRSPQVGELPLACHHLKVAVLRRYNITELS